MTMPLIEQPDVEAHVWAQLAPLKGVTMWAYSANQQDRAGWIMAHFVQVDARHVDKRASRDLAERVRQIITGLADVPWDDGCVCFVQPVEGPFFQPDDDGNPRYLARYEIRVHPPRRATVPAGL